MTVDRRQFVFTVLVIVLGLSHLTNCQAVAIDLTDGPVLKYGTAWKNEKTGACLYFIEFDPVGQFDVQYFFHFLHASQPISSTRYAILEDFGVITTKRANSMPSPRQLRVDSATLILVSKRFRLILISKALCQSRLLPDSLSTPPLSGGPCR